MAYIQIGLMQFESKGGNKYKVKIYKRGAEGATVRELTPSVSPFVTREDKSDDPMEPLRGSTGYCRFWYDGGLNASGVPYWVDFMPTDATEMKVILTDSTDAIMWQGYVKPSQYSHDYNEPQQDIELPLVSMLKVLEAIEMDATHVTETASWRKLLVEAINAADWSVDTFHVPYEWGTREMNTEEAKAGVKDFNCLAPLVTKVSRFAWFDTTDAKNDADPNWKEYQGATYAEMLADWCRYWGWTMREQGKDIYFVTQRTMSYRKVAWSFMSTEEYMGIPMDTIMASSGPSDMMEAATTTILTDAKLDGTAHTLNMSPAVRTVIVKADSQEMERDILEVPEGEMEYVATGRGVYDPTGGGGGTDIEESIFCYQSKTPNIEAWSCDVSGSVWHKNTVDDWKAGARTNSSFSNKARTCYCKLDIFNQEEKQDKKNFSYIKGFWYTNRLSLNMATSAGQQQMYIDIYSQPILRVTSKKSVWYQKDSGYLAVNMRIGFVDGPRNKYLITVRVGDKVWDGTQWTTEITSRETITTSGGTAITFDKPKSVWVEFENDGTELPTKFYTFDTVDMKTLDMPCNGAAGYLIPISDDLEGKISIVVYPSYLSESYWFLLQNVGVSFFPSVADADKERESVNKYYANTDASGSETHEISLRLATINNNNPGFGLLHWFENTANGETYRTPATPGTAAIVSRPEEVLLSTARNIYGNRRMMLEMVTTIADRERPMDKITRAEWTGAFMPAAESIEWAEDRRTVTLLGNQ